MENKQYDVLNNTKDLQFETLVNGNKAFLSYRFYKKDIAFIHTEVPPEIRGAGIAKALAVAAFAYAKDNNMKVINFCPYVASFIIKYNEYRAQLDPEFIHKGN